MTNFEEEASRIFFEVITKAVIKKIVTAVPFLGLPVIGNLFSLIVFKLAEKFWDEAKLYGSLLKIEFKVERQRVEYEEATEKLKQTLSVDDEEEKKKARDEYREKLRNLIVFDIAS